MDDHEPSWGAADAIAFQRDGAKPAVYVMRADGTGATRLIESARNPSWWQPRQ